MSSRIFQSVIIQMKDATDRTIGVTDHQGFVVACSELSMIGSYLDALGRGVMTADKHSIVKLTVQAAKFTKQAAEKIEKAGGKAEVM